MWDGGAEYRGCRRAGAWRSPRSWRRRWAHGALAIRVDAGAVAGAASLAEVGAGDMSEATFYKHELASRHVGRRCAGLAGEPQGQALAGSPFLTRRDYGPGCCSVRRWGWCSATCCGVDDPRRARVATDLCRLCFTAGRDGADVWPGMENRRCRRGTGALLVTPSSLLLVNFVFAPLALPVIGNVGGMALGSVTAFMLYRRLPWLTAHDNAPPIVAAAPPEQVLGRAGSCAGCWRTLPNRPSLAMSGRAPASCGVLLATALNALSPAYGSGLWRKS